MNIENIIDTICNFVLQKRNFSFHVLLTILTCGLWPIVYFIIYILYNNKSIQKLNRKKQYLDCKKQQIINKMDYGTVQSLLKDGKFRNEYKRYLVQVTSHGDCCKLCKKWEKKILIDDIFSNGKDDGKHILLSQAIKEGLFHNGCKHDITTYYPELEDIENETDKEYQEDLKYINNKINEMIYKK